MIAGCRRHDIASALSRTHISCRKRLLARALALILIISLKDDSDKSRESIDAASTIARADENEKCHRRWPQSEKVLRE